MCAPREAGRGGKAGAGSGRSFGRSRQRAGGQRWGRPGPAAPRGLTNPAVSGRGRLGPAALRPHPGLGPAADPGPRDGRRRAREAPGSPCSPAPLLFLNSGFRAEFGEAVWTKADFKDAS